MRKLTIATAAAAMILGLGANAAQADGARGWNQRPQDHRTERRGEVRRHGPAAEIVRVGVHRHYFDENIPLRRLLGLDRDYRGYRIQSVTLKVRPNTTRAHLALLANGRMVDRAYARHTRRIDLTPRGDRTLGRDLNRLQLAVRGRAYIDSIQVTLRAPRHGRDGGRVERSTRSPRATNATEQIVRIILGQIELADGRY